MSSSASGPVRLVKGDLLKSPAHALVNTVNLCDRIVPWTFGLQAFFSNLAARGLLR